MSFPALKYSQKRWAFCFGRIRRVREIIHGGDIYRNRVDADFSVNINPFGVPAPVREAMVRSLDDAEKYPDIRYEKLKCACAEKLGIKAEYLVFGNGSSELFMAVSHACRPKNTLIPVPSFYGYEHAFDASGIRYYQMKEEDGFSLTDDFLAELDEDTDMVVLASPNNPTGALTGEALLLKILDTCREKKIRLVLDECFTEFAGGEYSLISRVEEYPNLCIIRSFTKIYAIPSVRLGFLICADTDMIKAVNSCLPEWNVSGIAEAAGLACLSCDDYVKKSTEYVKTERQYLKEELIKCGMKVYDSSADFLLIRDERFIRNGLPESESAGQGSLYRELLKEGILIRDCSNFRGLREGYYRIAVKTHKENMRLTDEIKKLYKEA